MFYAGAISEILKLDVVDNARIIASMEASHLLKNIGFEGEQLITFGKWVVTKDIPLLNLLR